MRRLRWILAAAAAFLLLVAFAGFLLVRSDWLREKIRTEIITEVEKVTGGKADLGRFDYDWHNLTVRLDGFVLHGREARGDAPLLAVDRISLHLRIVSLLRGDVQISAIDAEKPHSHLVVYPDGSTNIPGPKAESGVARQKILDLKLARFDVRNGVFLIDSSGATPVPVPFEARGENLAAGIVYEAAMARYAGNISIGHAHVMSLDLQMQASAALEKSRLVISTATLKTAESQVVFRNAVVNGFHAPVTTAAFDAVVSLAEAATILKAKYQLMGKVTLKGSMRLASLSDYALTGDLRGSGISIEKLHNVRVSAGLQLTPARLLLSGVSLDALGGHAAGTVETSDYKSFHASGVLAHFDLRELAGTVTRQALPYDGSISGKFDARGRPGLMDLDAQLSVSPAAQGAPVRGEIAVRYGAAGSRVDLGDSWIELPHTRLSVAGKLGDRLNVKLESADVADLLPALDLITQGTPPSVKFASLVFEGAVSGRLPNPVIAGHASFQEGSFDNQTVQSFSGDVTASRASATASHVNLIYHGVHVGGAGSIQLTNWTAPPASPVTATVEIAGASLADILSASGHKEVQVTGTLNTTARITGTLGNPLADADVTLTRGLIYAQPFDSISGRLQIVNRSDQALTGVFVSGPKRVNITARFSHAGTQFPAGMLEFNLTSNTMPLNQIALVRARQPDIRGYGKFHADGSVRISHDAKHEIQFNLAGLNADASANGVELEGRTLGDARLTAQTQGDVMTARFDSNAASASIRGEGTIQLSGDYAMNGRLSFTDAGLNSLVALIVKEDDARNLEFDGTAEGSITIHGPLRKPSQMSASFDIPHLSLHALPGSALAQELPGCVVTNAGAVRATLTNSSLKIDSAHFKAAETDLTVDGSVALTETSPLNLRVAGTVNLALARTINRDLTSTGSVTLNASIRGRWQAPDVSGSATIRNADFHYADFANGLTGANGEITFSGSHATIQSFSAQSGGGKVGVTGFAALTNGLLSFRVEAQAREVRVRYPEGISSVSDADLTFAGTSQRSETSGVISVHRVSINPKSDAANILANAVQPIQTPASKTGLAANMNLDVQISTAPDVTLQTSVTQSLQADANLRLRGTVTNPALIGRINITQGEIVFFGNKYSINSGSISFFNPARIDPVLNIDLETKARGVDVILTVSGPMTKLGFSYRSDPPLQFSDIVALLATGRAPTDSTLAIRETGQSQNFQQLGASDLIGQAIANPVAGRLQRFFGVSRLKIDPSLTGITGSPEARLTIEQQVTPEILFTYITDVSSTSTQLIRVEWSFNRHWSAILIREENGYVGLDFAYKKRFK